MTWDDMFLTWNDYTVKWDELTKIVSWGSIFNINIWDKINVRNIDYENILSDLIVVRKEFNGDFLKFYLWSYRKNYALTWNQ